MFRLLFLVFIIPAISFSTPPPYKGGYGVCPIYHGSSTKSKVITTGTKTVLFLRVEFSDKKFTKDEAFFNQLISRFVAYYNEVSYGKLHLVCTLSGTYTLAGSMTYYGDPEKPSELIANAKVQTTTAGYDHIMVLHAGYGEETSGKTEDIYSQTLSDSIIPEIEIYNVSPLGVWCHEFGHQL
ncbi:MAG: hypothetical protein AAB267_02310, partial [Candidatus Desantisbacteria bacterium]